jgi:thiol-disulfide isomerase/thioredoxin
MVMLMAVLLLVCASAFRPPFVSIHGSRRCPTAQAKLPPIASQVFVPLSTPANYSEVLASVGPDVVSVIKFQAPYCRSCRQTSPLLDRAAKKWPSARYFSLDLIRNGKAAGERMNRFFASRNVTTMPHIEVYAGSELVSVEVVPPSRLELFSQAVGAAVIRLQEVAATRGVSRQLVLLRQLLRAGAAGAREPRQPAVSGGAERFFAARRGVRETPRGSSAPAPRRAALARRGAPQRGATGGRRKGWR